MHLWCNSLNVVCINYGNSKCVESHCDESVSVLCNVLLRTPIMNTVSLYYMRTIQIGVFCLFYSPFFYRKKYIVKNERINEKYFQTKNDIVLNSISMHYNLVWGTRINC
jgi:hypothetical protein